MRFSQKIMRYSFSVIVLLLCWSACSPQKQPRQTSGTSVIPLPDEQDSTRWYQYEILYPDSVTQPVLADTMQQFARLSKQLFLDMIPQDTSLIRVMPWELSITFNRAAQTQRFTTYLATTYQFTGGAHGLPAAHNFTLDRQTNTLIELPDLFPDTTALQPISDYVIARLPEKIYEQSPADSLDAFSRKWIKEGAAPLVNNYATAFPDRVRNKHATGLTVIFSAYQIGPYAIGMPRVFIPDSVFFDKLKETYQSAFSQ